MKSIALFLLALFLFFTVTSFAESDEFPINGRRERIVEKIGYTCGADSIQGVQFEFCHSDLIRSHSEDVIFFLHGLFGSARTWFEDRELRALQDSWHNRGYYPTIITVSLGKEWLLVESPDRPLLSIFSNGILPRLEELVGGLHQGRRHLIGLSMGGFNAAQLLFKSELVFSKVALLCPAITTVGPFDSDAEIRKYMQRTGARKEYIQLLLALARRSIADSAEWRAHNPLQMIRDYKGTKRPDIYVSVGSRDEFGFQEGAQVFSGLAKKKGLSSLWATIPGGHCSFDHLKALEFFLKD